MALPKPRRFVAMVDRGDDAGCPIGKERWTIDAQVRGAARGRRLSRSKSALGWAATGQASASDRGLGRVEEGALVEMESGVLAV